MKIRPLPIGFLAGMLYGHTIEQRLLNGVTVTVLLFILINTI